MGYTLITGACGHLGGAFVKEVQKENVPLFLTGRNEEKLEKKRAEILESGYGAPVEIFAADLTKKSDRNALFAFAKEKNFRFSRLINVAGADIQKAFQKYTQDKIAFQCRINFESAASLCKIALDLRDETLEIVNVSSVSGIYPMPYFALYSAAKGALTSFSQSLRMETKGKGVKVCAVLPGAMPTRDDVKEQIKGQGLWGKLAAKSPEFVARKSLKAVRKNKAKYIPGFWNRVMNFGTRILPLSWKMKFIARRWSKIEKDAF